MTEFNAKLGKLVFSFEWRLTLLTGLLVPALVLLGCWQLERGEEKLALAERHSQRMALPPLVMDDVMAALNDAASGALADRRVVFRGSAVAGDYLLLDNRLRDGRFGYEVVALIDAADYRVPVNLGWLAADPARRSRPTISLPTQTLDWHGRIYQSPGPAYLLDEQAPLTQLPTVIQAYEPTQASAQLEQWLNSPVAPFTVRLDPRHPAAYRADWRVVNQTPDKHTAYAVQWFTMGLVLLLAFVLRSSNLSAVLRGRLCAQ